MKRLLFIAFIFSLQSLHAQAIHVHSANFRAITRKDNSFVTYDDSISQTATIPLVAKKRIANIYTSYRNDPFAEGYKPLIFKVRYNSRVDIYVLKIHAASGITYKFLAYDHFTRKITQKPVAIFGKWMENNEDGFEKDNHLLSGQLLYFKDGQVVIKERTHNGTVYNAEDDHYYTLDSHMRFRQLLCIESKSVDDMSDCLIRRTLKNDTLICTLNCKKAPSKLVGKVRLGFKPDAHVISKKIIDSAYRDLLVSSGSVSEKRFLNKGSSYTY